MSKTRSDSELSRRGLLKGAGLAGAAAAGAPLAAKAQTAGQPDGPPRPVGPVTPDPDFALSIYSVADFCAGPQPMFSF
jgi:hypothetical protein